MKSILKLTSILLLTACFSSCFEIREEVNMKADGSGEITWVADFSQSKDNVRRYLTMDKVQGYKVPKPYEIDALLSQAKAALSKVEGITYVQQKADWSNYIFSISARFADVRVLNEAIATMEKSMDSKKTQATGGVNFHFENGRFQRNFDYPPKPKEFQELPSTQRYMLESARLISIYRFEENIVNFSNKKARLSPSGKAIMLQMPVAGLAKGSETLANSITFGSKRVGE